MLSRNRERTPELEAALKEEAERQGVTPEGQGVTPEGLSAQAAMQALINGLKYRCIPQSLDKLN